MRIKSLAFITMCLSILSGCTIGYEAPIKKSDKIFGRPESAKTIVTDKEFPFILWYDESKWELIEEPGLPGLPERADPVSSGDPTSDQAFNSTKEGDRAKSPIEAGGEAIFEELVKENGPSLCYVFVHKKSWQDLEATLAAGGGVYAFVEKRRIPVSYESLIRKASKSIKHSHISSFDSEIRTVNYIEMLYLNYGILNKESVNMKMLYHVFSDNIWSVYLGIVTPAVLYEDYENDINELLNGLDF